MKIKPRPRAASGQIEKNMAGKTSSSLEKDRAGASPIPRASTLKSMTTLLAVDPSLTSSGWAHFQVRTGRLLAAGTLCAPGTEHSMQERLRELQISIERLFERLKLTSKDFVICEGPAPLVKNPLSSLKVEQVRSVFEAVARANTICVPGRINPRTVHTELLSLRGKQLLRAEVKVLARETAMRLYGDYFKRIASSAAAVKSRRKHDIPQDVVDALLIGALALSRLQMSERMSIDPYAVFASKKRLGNLSSGRRFGSWSESDLKKIGTRQK